MCEQYNWYWCGKWNLLAKLNYEASLLNSLSNEYPWESYNCISSLSAMGQITGSVMFSTNVREGQRLIHNTMYPLLSTCLQPLEIL